MSTSIITPPAIEPVHLSELKAQLNITDVFEDAALIRHLGTARAHVADETDRALATSTWLFMRHDWPATERFFEIPKGRLQTVASLNYIDPDGAEQTLPATDYTVEIGGEKDLGAVVLNPDKSWPSIRTAVANPIRVQFTAGWKVYQSTVGVQEHKLTWASGDKFSTDWRTGHPVILAGRLFNVASVTDEDNLVLMETPEPPASGSAEPLQASDLTDQLRSAVILAAEHMYQPKMEVFGRAPVDKGLDKVVAKLVGNWKYRWTAAA